MLMEFIEKRCHIGEISTTATNDTAQGVAAPKMNHLRACERASKQKRLSRKKLSVCLRIKYCYQ